MLTSRRAAVTIAALLVPLSATAQSLAFGLGPSVPIGSTNDRLGGGYSIAAGIVTRTLSFLDFRFDATFTELRSKSVQGGRARMAAASANVAAFFSRAPFAYFIPGVGAYRSSFTRTPISIDNTIDIGFNMGAGLRGRLKRRVRESEVPQSLNVFLEGRVHFVLSEVKPTIFLPITGGLLFSAP